MKYEILLSLMLITLVCSLQAKDDGKRLFDAGEYEQAIRYYEQVLSQHPDWEEAHFGRGAALYKSERYEEALQAFERAIPDPVPQRKATVFYNMGNAFLKANKLEESLQFYKRALELNPKDYDAKHNFELVRQMLQEQPPPSQQNQAQEEGEQKEEPQSGKSEQPQRQEQSERDSQTRQPPQTQQSEEKKSREEAAQVLDALKDDEKKLMQERMKTKYSGLKKEKDW